MKRMPGIEKPLTEQANPASASIDALPTEEMLRIVIGKFQLERHSGARRISADWVVLGVAFWYSPEKFGIVGASKHLSAGGIILGHEPTANRPSVENCVWRRCSGNSLRGLPVD
jgi:hypothetical protein